MFGKIEKSGTGIGKSGTGIEKSGTGIEKSGTGIGRCAVALFACAAILISSNVLASDTRLAVSTQNGHAIVSVHGDSGVMIGVSAMPLNESGYTRVSLYPMLRAIDSGFAMGLMVQGSGSGAAGESIGPANSSTLVQGSGSGSATESVSSGGKLMVQGSGSGASGEGCVDGATVMVQGSGSGAASESDGCANVAAAWGVAEVVVDHSGTHVVVHRVQADQMEEFLIAFIPESNGMVYGAPSLESNQGGFVVTP